MVNETKSLAWERGRNFTVRCLTKTSEISGETASSLRAVANPVLGCGLKKPPGNPTPNLNIPNVPRSDVLGYRGVGRSSVVLVVHKSCQFYASPGKTHFHL